MLCYHSNDTPQGKTQADTVVLEVTMVNQDKGGLEEGEEDYSGLQREGGKRSFYMDQPNSSQQQKIQLIDKRCVFNVLYSGRWKIASFPGFVSCSMNFALQATNGKAIGMRLRPPLIFLFFSLRSVSYMEVHEPPPTFRLRSVSYMEVYEPPPTVLY